ncbi:MAG: cyclic nucleotide-binding domain-containing protein [Myxococcota bacterium]
MHIRAFGKSDKGLRRQHNEDAFLIDHDRRIYLLADGMGGHNAGDVASRMFVQIVSKDTRQLLTHLDEQNLHPEERRRTLIRQLPTSFARASASIHAEGLRTPASRGMGTTGVLVVPDGQGIYISHVGDSRVYLFRNDQLYQLTEDHSFVMVLFKEGRITVEEMATHPQKNLIVRSVGLKPTVEADTLYLDLFPGDRFIACSDGLTDMVTDRELADMLTTTRGPRMVEQAVVVANQRGGVDNITLIALEVEHYGGSAPTSRPHQARFGVIERVRFLRDIFLFANMTDHECIKINRILYQREFTEGQTVLRQGDQGDALFIVAQGSVGVWKGDIHLISIGPGGHFGELALIGDQHQRSADIVTETSCVLFTIQRRDLLDLIDEDKVLGNKLLWAFTEHLGDRVRDLSQRLSQTP